MVVTCHYICCDVVGPVGCPSRYPFFVLVVWFKPRFTSLWLLLLWMLWEWGARKTKSSFFLWFVWQHLWMKPHERRSSALFLRHILLILWPDGLQRCHFLCLYLFVPDKLNILLLTTTSHKTEQNLKALFMFVLKERWTQAASSASGMNSLLPANQGS